MRDFNSTSACNGIALWREVGDGNKTCSDGEQTHVSQSGDPAAAEEEKSVQVNLGWVSIPVVITAMAI